MSLSNTATPVYYGQFRDSVMRGDIPVCREISMEMNRIDDLIADRKYYYDENAIDGFIAFCEQELTLTDGSELHLLDSFKLWAESLLAWFYFIEQEVWIPDGHGGGEYQVKMVKRRLIKKQFLIVARGAAKSMYLSCIQNYFLNIDTSTTHQVTTAPTMKQAEEVLSPIRTSITRARGPFFKFLTYGSLQNTTGSKANRVKLASTKKGIQNFLTGSLLEIRPMTIDKLQGLRSKYNTIDEWLSGDTREDPIGAIEQSASKAMSDYIIVAASSEGTVRNGAGDDIKMELLDTLKGEFYQPHVSIWYYRLDNLDEVNDPRMWPKAQPNIGKTVSYEVYQLDVERAEKAPASRNDILAKRFGIPMEGYTYFFTYEETIPHRKRFFDGMPCALGADMSQGDDFCAFDFLFPAPNGLGIKVLSFISERTHNNLPLAMRIKYDEFIKEGTLIVMNGSVLDMEEVYEAVDEHIVDRDYDIRCFGYDPYNAKVFVDKWIMHNGEFGTVKVPQGARTESVPLGELKGYSEERELLFDEKLMQFSMGNAVTLEDTNGNRKLLKKRHSAKIDNVSALMDAYVAYKENKEAFE